MRSPADSSHLAVIEPLADREAGRVLSLRWKLLLNFSLLMIPAIMVGLFAPIVGLVMWIGSGKTVLAAAIAIPTVFAAQVSWAGTYPEWPMNRWLTWRLRRSCRNRLGDRHVNWIDSARMVEWVPRDNWGATKLDTAKDVMLIQVDETGVRMEGDFARYHFPPGSIIDVEVDSVRPTGCFHRLHFMVLTVRSIDGPIEFPLAFRDFRLGSLRSRQRLSQTDALCRSIRGIATGGDFSYYGPEGERHARIENGHGIDRTSADQTGADRTGANRSGVLAASDNPYAAPRSV